MKYLYNVNYNVYDETLCHFEMKAVFGIELKDKVFFSNQEINPSISTFLKNRIEIICQRDSFDEILAWLEEVDYKDNDFIVKTIPIVNRGYNENVGKRMAKEVGMRIYGFPNFTNPKVVYGIAEHNGIWYFGYLEQNNLKWRERKKKPFSFSSALNIHFANALVNIGCQGKYDLKVIDPCCGVGTVMIEALEQDIDIVGYEINPSVSKLAQKNLNHFGYKATINTGDMKEINDIYDVAIIDLPYNNFSHFDQEQQNVIINHAKEIAKRVIMVSSRDIRDELKLVGYNIIDSCKSEKTVKRDFGRYIFICET